MPTKLRVFKIFDPVMCIKCQHRNVAEVEWPDGRRKIMYRCRRLDCDNWSKVTRTMAIVVS